MCIQVKAVTKQQVVNHIFDGHQFKWELLSATNNFIASYQNENMLGVVSYRQIDNFLVVDNIEVSSSFHNFGIGSNLVANVAKIALDTPEIEGFLVLTSKTLTVDFYNKLFNMSHEKTDTKFVVFPQNSLYAVSNFLTMEVE